MNTYIIGHKNPDTDSIVSAIAVSYLKNKMGEEAIPCRIGKTNKETDFVLDYFNLEPPKFLNNVKIQMKDINYSRVVGVLPSSSILQVYREMERRKLKSMPIVNKSDHLVGLVTMKDIAMALIRGDIYHLKTSMLNILQDLEAKLLNGQEEEIDGFISVIAFYSGTVIGSEIINENSIIIVGNRFDIIEYAIKQKVRLIIVTGGCRVPKKLLLEAEHDEINIISTDKDSYTTSKLIHQCNYINSVMKNSGIIQFGENEYLDDLKEEIINSNHSNYPVINSEQQFLGFVGKRHLFNPDRKRVVLVDHNEYGQSVDGLKEAEITEIIDHHKIGDISTSMPIMFRNVPVGSTCTIVYYMFKNYNIDIEKKIAGGLISGILSDTLMLKSPTTTDSDREAVAELNKILALDIDLFTMEMFKTGTSLEGQSIKDIFYKDFKEFIIDEHKIGIGQVFTLDIEDVFNRKDEFVDFIGEVHHNREYNLTLMMITDILHNGSYLLYESLNSKLISTAFEIGTDQGLFVKGVVSRKKQALPKIMMAYNMLK